MAATSQLASAGWIGVTKRMSMPCSASFVTTEIGGAKTMSRPTMPPAPKFALLSSAERTVEK